MRRILLDQNAPLGLRTFLRDFDVVTARFMGWEALANGDLIAAAEKHGFEVLVTADRNLRYQQNIAGRQIGIVVLTTSHWATISRHADRVLEAVRACGAGAFVEVAFDPAPRREKPPSLHS